jgi:hypothetical protein
VHQSCLLFHYAPFYILATFLSREVTKLAGLILRAKNPDSVLLEIGNRSISTEEYV